MPNLPESDFEKIAVLENIIEAQVMAAMLEDEGIPHRIRSFHDTAYDGLFQFQLGWGAIYAPGRHKSTILELLEKMRSDDDDVDNPPKGL
jgi:hypothetical protein